VQFDMTLKSFFSRFAKRADSLDPDVDDFARKAPAPPELARSESGFFSTQFLERPEDVQTLAAWSQRALMVEAKPLDRNHAERLFFKLWGSDRYIAGLSIQERARFAQYLHFVTVPSNREVISQDEQGDYMVIVLDGSLAVDRVQPWGGRIRLAEAYVGDMLGEMSLLDTGARFSACTTITPCALAIIDAQHLDEMIRLEPRLGLALLASLSRRLSLRLRQVSARLSTVLSGN
jgi:CRP/FNR family transcriptional regulator, cyclic AMP receptor protein